MGKSVVDVGTKLSHKGETLTVMYALSNTMVAAKNAAGKIFTLNFPEPFDIGPKAQKMLDEIK